MYNAHSLSQPRLEINPRAWLQRAWSINRPLTIVGLMMIALFGITLVGISIDPRVITGAPAWLKPMKFAISIAIYSFTLVWLLQFIQGHPRLVRWITNVTATALVVEIVIIMLQAARGTTSHFNATTPLNAALFRIMAGFIVLLWLANVVAVVLLIRQRMSNTAFGWSLRLGLLIAIVGMAVAFLMTMPSAKQQAALAQGAVVTSIGAHSVGVADGGPGLPVVGWSTEGGDLRVAHFIGIHAMQVLPFIGWLVTRRRFNWISTGGQTTLVLTAGGAYLACTLLLTWQALRGQSVIAPDQITLGALAAIIVITAAIATAVLVRTRGHWITRSNHLDQTTQTHNV